MLDGPLNDEIADLPHKSDDPHWLAIVTAARINQTEQMHQKRKLRL